MRHPKSIDDLLEIINLPFGDMVLMEGRVSFSSKECWPKEINYSGYRHPNVELEYVFDSGDNDRLLIVFPGCEWFMYPMFADLSLLNSRFTRLGTFEVADNDYTRIKSAAILYEFYKSAQQGGQPDAASRRQLP